MRKHPWRPFALLLSLCLAVTLFAGCGDGGQTSDMPKGGFQNPADTAWTLASVTYHFYADGGMVIWLDGEVYYGIYQWEDTAGTIHMDGQSVGLKMNRKGLWMEDPDGEYSRMDYAGAAGGDHDRELHGEELAGTSWAHEDVVYTFCEDGTAEIFSLENQKLYAVGKYYWNYPVHGGILVLDGEIAAEIWHEDDCLVFSDTQGNRYELEAYGESIPG